MKKTLPRGCRIIGRSLDWHGIGTCIRHRASVSFERVEVPRYVFVRKVEKKVEDIEAGLKRETAIVLVCSCFDLSR
jgi:hypothetical protein